MRPTFSITANGNDITGDISDRLVSMSIVDTVDEKSDSLDITLEDTTGTLALPTKGARLEVAIGYNGANTKVGSYVVDEVQIEGPPDTVTITASSTPFVDGKDGTSSSFQAKKTRSWDGKTIGDIVAKIASECSLEPVVDEALKSLTIPHIDQLGESDSNLLIRIARRYGAVLKPADGRLVLAAEDGGKTTSGKELGLTLMRSDVANYRVRIGGKVAGIKQVKATVHNYETGQADEVKVDVEMPEQGASSAEVDAYYERILADSGTSVETAKKSAQTTAKRIARASKSVDLTMAGRIDAVAGMHLTLVGFRDGINGKWKAVSVRHTISRSGWLTAISGELAQ